MIPLQDHLALAVLLTGTAIAYLWNPSVNGWANSFYAAAVQSGARSWKAFFFGSSDWANAITVDKTPAALWPMEISVRILGFHPWSMALPQIVLGVASVALLWASLRRTIGPAAGLIGGLALAVTPVAALMFRFNNPDALLVFLMIAAVWAMTRALDSGRWRWLLLCGALVGLGFLAKQLQVLLVLPPLAITYLVAGPPPRLGKRLLQLLAAGASMTVGAGWWVLIAQLWPTDSRPYFGGSQHNSIIELTLGYNGLDRISGGSGGGPGGPPLDPGQSLPAPPGGTSGPLTNSVPDIGGAASTPRFGPMGGHAGLGRLFSESVGGQVAWLIPATLVLLAAALALRGRAPRTDPERAILLLWGGWALVTGLVFSFMKGLFHEYYTVALAPALAGTVGIGAVALWRERERLSARIALSAATALTTSTAVLLLSRVPDFVPWLRWCVAAVGTLSTVALLFPRRDRLALAAALGALLTAFAAPSAYSAQTIATEHTGGIVYAGPRTNTGIPSMTRWRPSTDLVVMLRENAQRYTWAAATVGSTTAADLQLAVDHPIMAVGGFGGSDPAPTLNQFQQYVTEDRIHYFLADDHPGWRSDTEANKIAEWVRNHFTAKPIEGRDVYDLTAPRRPGA